MRTPIAVRMALRNEFGSKSVIRPIVVESDLSRLTAVLEFCNAAREKDFDNVEWYDPHDAAYLKERLEAEGAWGAIVTAAPRNLVTVGFIMGLPLRDEEGRVIPGSEDLRLLMVHPMFWRSGVGRGLLEWAADFNRSRDTKRLLLWVHEDNTRARALYESAGYVANGEVKDRKGVRMVQYCLDLTSNAAR